MKRFLLGICLFIASATTAGALDAWEWLGPPFAVVNTLTVDGEGTIYIGGTYMGVRISEDGGVTWIEAYGPNDPSEMVVTPTGSLVSNDDWTSGGVWVTEDNGTTWDEVAVAEAYDSVSHLVVLLATGEVYATIGSEGIHVSSDGGHTWQVLPNGPVCQTYHDLAAAPNGDLYLKGDAGLWRSQDEGASWMPLAVPATATEEGYLSCAPTGEIFMAGLDSVDYYAHLFRSTNSGESWDGIGEGLPLDYAAYCGFVYGSVPGQVLLADRYSGIYRSETMGDTWVPDNDGLTTTSVSALANGPGWIHYAGTSSEGVFKSTADGVAAIIEPPAGASVLLAQSHPNPASTAAMVSFTLVEPGTARLTLHDAGGRLLRELAAMSLGSGNHTVAIDISDLSTGSYFYRLAAGDRVQARRLVVARR